MATVINQRIVHCAVVDEKTPVSVPKQMMDRPALLTGKTYKIACPLTEHALYVTINDQGGKPFEIFINSKAMEHFQWIVALTRVISAVFRQCDDVRFLVEELKSIFDPKGGYFRQGKYIPSLVAELGIILEQHLGIVQDDSLAQAARAMVAEKQMAGSDHGQTAINGKDATTGKLLCPQCQELAVVVTEGCATCLSCGSSKCN